MSVLSHQFTATRTHGRILPLGRRQIRAVRCALIAAAALVWMLAPEGPLRSWIALGLATAGATPRPIVAAAAVMALLLAFTVPGLGRWCWPVAYVPLLIMCWSREGLGNERPPGIAAVAWGGACVGAAVVILGAGWAAGPFPVQRAGEAFLMLYGAVVVGGMSVALRLLLVRRAAWARWAAVCVIPMVDHIRGLPGGLGNAYFQAAHLGAADPLAAQWGEWGHLPLGALVSAVNMLIAGAFLRWSGALQHGESKGKRARTAVALIAIVWAGGALRLWGLARPAGAPWTVTVVQFSDRPGSWRAGDAMTRISAALSCSRGPLVLPETTLEQPGGGEDADEMDWILTPERAASELAHHPGIRYMLAGVLIDRGDARDDMSQLFENVAEVVGPRGPDLSTRTGKKFLAPVGEATPLETIPLLGRAMQRLCGHATRTIPVEASPIIRLPDGKRVEVLFCNEHLLEDPGFRKGRHGPADTDTLVILADTNQLGYSQTERCLSRCGRRLLAVQTRRPLLYAANGGSEVFDATGTVVAAASPADKWFTFTVPAAGPPDAIARAAFFARPWMSTIAGAWLMLAIISPLISAYIYPRRSTRDSLKATY